MNREVTLLRGAEELERAGTLDNLRIAAGRASGERRGMVFSDSDVYKWLEAIAWELGREPSAELERLGARDDRSSSPPRRSRTAISNTWCQVVDPAWRWTDLEMGHELYCAGHLIQAGVAFARTTGDTTLLTVARRFADLIDRGVRAGHRDRHRRTPRGRGRARRALPADGRAPLPRAGRHAHRRGAGTGCSPAAASTSTTTRTPSPFATHARSSDTPCAPSISRPASPTSTPRRATRRCSPRCSASGTT